MNDEHLERGKRLGFVMLAEHIETQIDGRVGRGKERIITIEIDVAIEFFFACRRES